jgi:phytoene/squalene synthetase
MKQLYLSSQLLAKRYSTSFSAAMSLLSGPTKTALYNIYAYVRVADEMVQT